MRELLLTFLYLFLTIFPYEETASQNASGQSLDKQQDTTATAGSINANHLPPWKNSASDNYGAQDFLDLYAKYESERKAKDIAHETELTQLKKDHQNQVVRLWYALIGMIGIFFISMFSSYRSRQRYRLLIDKQNEELKILEEDISYKNVELEAKNISLDLLNKKLLGEITERENIENSSFARDRFLATMSHEMRTPLNTITGLSYTLLKENPREDQVALLQTLQFSANNLVVFINDVLTFSNIEAGKLNLEGREFSAQQTLTDIQKKFTLLAEEKGLTFRNSIDPNIPKQLYGDDIRLGQILTNLLTNTIKLTREGTVELRVEVQERRAWDLILKITIKGKDNHLDGQTFADLLKPLKVDDANFEGYDSQAFSLSIAKRLIELQNGKIEVETASGENTQFTVLLPFKQILPKKNTNRQVAHFSQNDLEGHHILVVEDNKINQLIVSKMLKRAGAEVSLAQHGLEAIEKLTATDFDLILMDIQMPQMDGYRTTSEIRRHHNEHKRKVPIIALTASAFLTEKEKAVLFGMNDHVGKPFSPDELMEKIKRCLKATREV